MKNNNSFLLFVKIMHAVRKYVCLILLCLFINPLFFVNHYYLFYISVFNAKCLLFVAPCFRK